MVTRGLRYSAPATAAIQGLRWLLFFQRCAAVKPHLTRSCLPCSLLANQKPDFLPFLWPVSEVLLPLSSNCVMQERASTLQMPRAAIYIIIWQHASPSCTPIPFLSWVQHRADVRRMSHREPSASSYARRTEMKCSFQKVLGPYL